MMSRKFAESWLFFIACVLLIAVLLVFGGKVGAQGETPVDPLPLVTLVPDAPPVDPVVVTPDTPAAPIGSFLDRLDPNVFLIVLLIGGALLAILAHLQKQAWITALRDSVPGWVRDPFADAIDGGSDVVLDELDRRAAETPDPYDDEQVEQLRRRIDALEEWLRANPQGAAPGAVKVNLDLPQG